MSEEYFEFGVLIEGMNAAALSLQQSKQTIAAVEHHPNFEVLEFRRLPDYSEILVVECTNKGIWTKNPIGIGYRERLALRFFPEAKSTPEVRALKKHFPDAPHQNHVLNGEPKSLCLYLDKWPALERSWTPEKHLNRILYWLSETANESLHRDDQPVEQVFFQGTIELVLPADFDDKVDDKNFLLQPKARPLRDKAPRIMVSSFVPAKTVKEEDVPLACIALTLPAIVHGQIEQMPNSLGELHDQLESRGAPVITSLFDQIKERVGQNGIPKSTETFTLMVLRIPILRKEGTEIERIERRGFVISAGLGELGVAGGALFEMNKRYQRFTLMVGEDASQQWRDIKVEPIECLLPFTREYARQAAGIRSEGPNGLLVGAGALGSSMLNIWHRQGWGVWTIIDPDHVKPHNLARHAAYEHQVGEYKADAVNGLFHSLYGQAEPCGTAIAEDARDFNNKAVAQAIKSNSLIVDASTTIEYPRDIAIRDDVIRAVTVFLTPSGMGAVLLIEDADRNLRLDMLEAQYYRSILRNHWGENHLVGNIGHLRVGGGCRDVSSVMSTELINVHSANLARQVRLLSEKPEALIRVWHSDPETGEVSSNSIVPSESLVRECGSWKIVWNQAIRLAVCDDRKNALPDETGGVLLGYVDLKLMRIYVVDALSAPKDSTGDRSGFTRGIEGLKDNVEKAQRLTGNIVSYIGEWHSHPSGSSANPSKADLHLLSYLAQGLQHDGLPALMLIVGEGEENFLSGSTG